MNFELDGLLPQDIEALRLDPPKITREVLAEAISREFNHKRWSDLAADQWLEILRSKSHAIWADVAWQISDMIEEARKRRTT